MLLIIPYDFKIYVESALQLLLQQTNNTNNTSVNNNDSNSNLLNFSALSKIAIK